jgi:G:T-mismatch repair DNA endonuclease (very short patch repair protein)
MPRPVLGGCLDEVTSTEATLSLAWPQLRVGLASGSDDPEPFDRAGWRVVRLADADVDAYDRVLEVVDDVVGGAVAGGPDPTHCVQDGSGLPPLELAWRDVYQSLASRGLPRPVLGCPLVQGHAGGPVVAVGWPGLRVGLAIDAEPPEAFASAGWTVARLTTSDLEAYGRVLEAADALAMWGLLAESSLGARRRVSEPEQVLLRALVGAGLPTPDRNLTFHQGADGTGRVLAVPDFAWEQVGGATVRVVLEVDGFYFHAGRQMAVELAAAAESDPQRRKQLLAHQRIQGAKDARKRRAMSALGWVVLVVHDSELDDEEAADEVAQSVCRVVDVRRATALEALSSGPMGA